jgi:choline dehydrogenase-like flavoprotein
VSTVVAYLYPLSCLPSSLTLKLETLVHKILVEDGQAYAVQTDDGAVIHADREIVVSAGAIDSPKLLMLSGIGPAEHLAQADAATGSQVRRLQGQPAASVPPRRPAGLWTPSVRPGPA